MLVSLLPLPLPQVLPVRTPWPNGYYESITIQ